MTTNDFDYELDEKLIAQTPLKKRDQSRLLVLDKKTGNMEHSLFCNIVDYMNDSDILVMNDTKVLPARLMGVKKETNALIEVLLLKDIGDDNWECLVKPAKRIKIGTEVIFGDGMLSLVCVLEQDDGIRVFKFKYKGILYEILDKLGEMPLPPYIHEKLEEQDRYQTVYAKNLGSAAAPTAGLHFTKNIINKLEKKGVKIVYITLHVGIGTFRPVAVDNVNDHKMHSEYYMMNKDVANILNNAKLNGNKIVSVGTTSMRTLETIIRDYNEFRECEGWTDIFIYPPYEFRAVDSLLTNFHLPKSTLLMLVSAFSNKEFILKAYKEAIEKEYRFFSFGDAMFIK